MSVLQRHRTTRATCGVDGMIYDDQVDATYVVHEFNKDAGEDDTNDEEEMEESEQDPIRMESVQQALGILAQMSERS